MVSRYSPNSLRILTALSRKISDGYELMLPLGIKNERELAEAIQPLLDQDLVSCTGTPWTEEGLKTGVYNIPLSKRGTVNQLLRAQPLGSVPSP